MGKKIMATPSTEPSKVQNIVKSLSILESDIASLDATVADMKQDLKSKSQQEISRIMEQIHQLATKEAESIIEKAKSEANAESDKILAAGKAQLADIKSKIEANFDDAVKQTTSMIMSSTISE
ncbi:MAG: hypothetical protein R1F52_03775 [Candidatus Nitrosoabyssus spongiisocia]|nr:MAG: hypothetical protein R1F52_03775 [Nitrosopumilaceae archaeon AB1(1)]